MSFIFSGLDDANFSNMKFYILVKAKKEKELQEQMLIEEMDEETYNKLPIERRKEIDDRLLEAKKLRLKR